MCQCTFGLPVTCYVRIIWYCLAYCQVEYWLKRWYDSKDKNMLKKGLKKSSRVRYSIIIDTHINFLYQTLKVNLLNLQIFLFLVAKIMIWWSKNQRTCFTFLNYFSWLEAFAKVKSTDKWLITRMELNSLNSLIDQIYSYCKRAEDIYKLDLLHKFCIICLIWFWLYQLST